MLINHLRTALRGLTRAKTHPLINIGGLAVGMAISILIGLWIRDELSYDKYHENYDRIVAHRTRDQLRGVQPERRRSRSRQPPPPVSYSAMRII